GCRLADVGDRELLDHQRVDERRDQRLLRPAATDRACATLELLVGGGENAKEVVRPRAQVMATVVPADRGQPKRFVVSLLAVVDDLLKADVAPDVVSDDVEQ